MSATRTFPTSSSAHARDVARPKSAQPPTPNSAPRRLPSHGPTTARLHTRDVLRERPRMTSFANSSADFHSFRLPSRENALADFRLLAIYGALLSKKLFMLDFIN